MEKGKPLYGDAGRPAAGLEPAVRSVCYITAQICVKERRMQLCVYPLETLLKQKTRGWCVGEMLSSTRYTVPLRIIMSYLFWRKKNHTEALSEPFAKIACLSPVCLTCCNSLRVETLNFPLFVTNTFVSPGTSKIFE